MNENVNMNDINDELLRCSCCSLVLESSEQAPCEEKYQFCNKCMTEWIEVKNVYAIDRLKWQKCQNLISTCQPNILEIGLVHKKAFAQSFYCLNSERPSFKVNILNNVHFMGIGLTPTQHRMHHKPTDNGSVSYFSHGSLGVNNKYQRTGVMWKRGDIIECGIKFPNNFISDGSCRATVYFSKNGVLVTERLIRIPCRGLFPTIWMTKKGKMLVETQNNSFIKSQIIFLTNSIVNVIDCYAMVLANYK